MKIETSSTLETSADAVWHVLGEQFGDISDWADAVLESSLDAKLGEGATRTCHLASGQLTEELTQFDRRTRSLTYAIRTGLPSFMRDAQNAWTIEPIDAEHCRVTSVITANMAWYAVPMAPLVRANFGKAMAGLMRQLQARASASAYGPARKETHAAAI